MKDRICWVATIALGAFCGTAAYTETFCLGSGRFLFLDCALLDTVEHARLTVNPPRFDSLVLIADSPWERGGITSYGNVFWDPEAHEYRLYYVPINLDVPPGFCLALATSQDGKNWEKPSLGTVEWNGSKDNNIVIWAQREGTVLLDPNAPPERRYACVSSHPDLKTRLFTSPDGIHFVMQEAAISPIHSDSQISSFWDPEMRLYFHYPRVAPEGKRATGFATTKTMNEPWPADIPVVLSRDDRDPPGMDLYTNACQKYAEPKAYLAFPTPYYHYNEPSERAYLNAPTLAKGGKSNDGTIETQLATSRDGRTWTRYRTPYISLGRYDGLDVKVAMMIPGFIFDQTQGRLYQYFMGYTFTHGDTQIRFGNGGRELGGVFRVEQRMDGFISLDFDYEGGSAVTAPFTFEGSLLSLNINTSASGEARVAVLDADGKEIDGYGLADARYINGDYIDKTAEWRNGNPDAGSLAGRPIRLRFECRGTKLYSFRFTKR